MINQVNRHYQQSIEQNKQVSYYEKNNKKMLVDIGVKCMRYIGSKANLLKNIENVINENIKEKQFTFCDLFSGTSIVGEYFKKDYEIISNDLMYFSYVIQKAKIENNSIPKFEKLKKIGILDPINYLEDKIISEDCIENNKYFITQNYSPYKNSKRMYLSVENAMRIDYIRQQIETWFKEYLINENEYFYLLACLIESVPFVSNITGTYGAFLKTWDKRALEKIKIRKIDILSNEKNNMSYNMDSNTLINDISGDILYLDPPYNSRQYLPNYHLLETIAKYDYPDIYGKTGLRPYTDKKSLFCNKAKVYNTLEELIKNAKFKYILISYSTDGLLSIDEIEDILKKYGIPETYRLYKIPYRKYKSKLEQETNELSELIFFIEKNNSIKNTNKQDSKIKSTKNIKKNTYPKNDKKYIKSPLNYVGGKYKILNQIIPLFPKEIDNFIDIFSGGFNVGINVDANKIICNDYNHFIIEIYKEFQSKDINYILEHIKNRISEFNLSKTNAEGFRKFRDFYNKNKNPLDLYVLVCFSFNYQFRFNSNLEYNNPFGKNRSSFSTTLEENLIKFINELQSKNIVFSNEDYKNIPISELKENDFVYCDPPYLITTGSYNDGNRGFKNWTSVDEIELLHYLDELNNKGVKFALSNVLEHKGKSNDILKEWCKKYNTHYLKNNYSNSSYNTTKGISKEVLITNYTI